MGGLPVLRRLLLPILVLLLALAAFGCATVDTGYLKVPRPAVAGDVLGPDDVVTVTVRLEDSLSGEFRVNADGTIAYPLLGALPAAGKTPSEVAEDLRARLADGYLRDPQVAVALTTMNSRKVSVLGEVTKPGRYPYREGMTLVAAVADAGGTTDSAVLAYVLLTRRIDGKDYSVQVPYRDITRGKAPDMELAPNDIVVVQESSVK